MIDLSNPSRIFELLEREPGFHLLGLATLGPGQFPECRTVVRRRVDEATRAVHIHTDVRSPKLAQLQADPRMSLLFYDAVTRVQVRCRAVPSIHIEDGVAHAAWQAAAPAQRAMYAAVESPGQIVAVHPPLPAAPGEDDPVAFRHFAVIVCYLTEIDVLELAPEQHRRVLMRWTGDRWDVTLVAP